MMKKMDKGSLQCTKMGADSLAENISAQFVCPSPKVWYFNEKKPSLGVRSPWSLCTMYIGVHTYIAYLLKELF